MITETTRACEWCSHLLPDPPAAAVCPRCARVAVPLHTEWPKGMKRWLFAQLLEQFWAPWRRATEQYRWERLLRSVIAGRQWGDRVVPYAVYATDCYAIACQQLTLASAAATPIDRSSTHVA